MPEKGKYPRYIYKKYTLFEKEIVTKTVTIRENQQETDLNNKAQLINFKR